MTKMGLITFEKTGHVLAAFTRTANPDGALPAAQVVGDALVLRDDDGDERVHLPPEHLAVQTVDRDDGVIASHRTYAVKDGLPVEVQDPGTAPTYAAATKELTIKLDDPAQAKVVAYTLFETGDDPPRLVPIEFDVGDQELTVIVTLSPGSYSLLVLVPGYRAQLLAATVS